MQTYLLPLLQQEEVKQLTTPAKQIETSVDDEVAELERKLAGLREISELERRLAELRGKKTDKASR